MTGADDEAVEKTAADEGVKSTMKGAACQGEEREEQR
jgi:hypothetical protein